MPEDDIEWESLTAISFDFLLVFKNKYYLRVYLDNCSFKIVLNQMMNYLDHNRFETD